jgi:hypothetical protein
VYEGLFILINERYDLDDYFNIVGQKGTQGDEQNKRCMPG